MITFTGKKRFTIHRNDASQEAYTDQYVKWLEVALESTDTSIHNWRVRIASPTQDNPFRQIDCDILDVGYADKVIVVGYKEATQ